MVTVFPVSMSTKLLTLLLPHLYTNAALRVSHSSFLATKTNLLPFSLVFNFIFRFVPNRRKWLLSLKNHLWANPTNTVRNTFDFRCRAFACFSSKKRRDNARTKRPTTTSASQLFPSLIKDFSFFLCGGERSHTTRCEYSSDTTVRCSIPIKAMHVPRS